jgi:hypothetical protein
MVAGSGATGVDWLGMATRSRSVRLGPDAFELLAREAERRGVAPETLADELLRAELAPQANDALEQALAGLAAVRAGQPEVDAVAVARDARSDLDARSS